MQREADIFSFARCGSPCGYETTAIITTRLYRVTHSIAGFDITDVWLPAPPAEILLNFTLHVLDPFATTIEEDLVNSNRIIVYPNPADNILMVKLLDATAGISYQIFSLDGKLIASSNTNISENNTFTINISDLIIGLYYLNITNNEVNTSIKFIKN